LIHARYQKQEVRKVTCFLISSHPPSNLIIINGKKKKEGQKWNNVEEIKDKEIKANMSMKGKCLGKRGEEEIINI